MISCIAGTLLEKDTNRIVIKVSGFGIEVQVPDGTLGSMPAAGSEVLLHTFLQVREDSLQLFGFETRRARDLFSQLLCVSGFGAQKALAVLSAFSPERFETVIHSGDADALTIVKGVGKKGAQRLLLEMKDKVGEITSEHLAQVPYEDRGPYDEAMEALVQLGYSRAEAYTALGELDLNETGLTTEQLLQEALRRMNKA